jgi:hypothetical protein
MFEQTLLAGSFKSGQNIGRLQQWGDEIHGYEDIVSGND